MDIFMMTKAGKTIRRGKNLVINNLATNEGRRGTKRSPEN